MTFFSTYTCDYYYCKSLIPRCTEETNPKPLRNVFQLFIMDEDGDSSKSVYNNFEVQKLTSFLQYMYSVYHKGWVYLMEKSNKTRERNFE